MTCRELDDQEALTQYGVRGEEWRTAPRSNESDVSLLLGTLTPEEAAKRVRKGRWPPADDDGARHTTVGALRAQGFLVRYTHRPANRLHVSAEVPDDRIWDDDTRARFDNCFGDPQYVKQQGS